MNYEKYTEKLLTQYKQAMDAYAQQIFIPMDHLSKVQSLCTKEHLRLPPAAGLSPIQEGDSWGGSWENIWLCFDLTLSEAYIGKKVWLVPHTGATEILGFLNGAPCGLINSKHDFVGGMHSALFIADCKEPASYQVALECYAGHFHPGTQPYGNYGRDQAEQEANVDLHNPEERARNCPNNGMFRHTFSGVDICIMDEDVNRLVFDLLTVLQLAQLPGENFIQGRAIRALKKAFPLFIQDPINHTLEEIDESARKVCAILGEALEKFMGEPDGSRGYVGVTGHSHMDTA